MILHRWGEIDYQTGREKMQQVHQLAREDGQNHLILCSHPAVFTVGSDPDVPLIDSFVKSDRGGSITCHTPGQHIFYFCFQVAQPPMFYRRVIRTFETLFDTLNLPLSYDKTRPGFYRNNRKLLSLGFRYCQGVSLHGVALNRDVDLDFHNQIRPCNLEGIEAGSLKKEGIVISAERLNHLVVETVEAIFDDAVQA